MGVVLGGVRCHGPHGAMWALWAVVGRQRGPCGALWAANVGRVGRVGRCGPLWAVVGRCGPLVRLYCVCVGGGEREQLVGEEYPTQNYNQFDWDFGQFPIEMAFLAVPYGRYHNPPLDVFFFF